MVLAATAGLDYPFRVLSEDFTNDALLLAGHGSTKNAASSSPVYQHAAELRRRQLFAEVREGFWKEEPQLVRIFSEIQRPRLFVAPLFISEGHFSDAVIPSALHFPPAAASGLARVLHRPGQACFYCQPVGTHERITDVVLSRAREVTRQFPFPANPPPAETTLFVVGHGTDLNENSRKSIDRQVERIRAMKEYAEVHGVFLEEPPLVGECYRLAATRFVVVVPFFISDGMHTQEDIPALLGESADLIRRRHAAGMPPWRNPTERNGKLVWYARAVGTAPEIADVILERVREAAR